MTWERLNSLEAEIASLRVERDHARAQRDRARATAVRLEQQLEATVCALCGGHLVNVPVWGNLPDVQGYVPPRSPWPTEDGPR